MKSLFIPPSFLQQFSTIDHETKFYIDLINKALYNGFSKINLENIVKEQIKVENGNLYIQNTNFPIQNKNVFIFGGGKGTYTITKELISILGANYTSGWINVPKNQPIVDNLSKTIIFKTGHPIPDTQTFDATKVQIDQLLSLTENDIAIIIITGGASALFELPVPDIPLDSIITTYQYLVTSGLTIQEINTIRKHLSQIKGGKLPFITKAQIIALIISDVPDNDLSSIGSGPTIEDHSTFAECLYYIQKSNLSTMLPQEVYQYLEKNSLYEKLETFKKFPFPMKVSNFLLCSNSNILNELYNQFSSYIETSICSNAFKGEANTIGSFLAKFISFPYTSVPKCLLYGGESVVTIDKNTFKSDTAGGRNQELIVSFINYCLKEKLPHQVFILSLGTDGIDGNSLHAGAFFCNVNSNTYQYDLEKLIIDLINHNSGNALPFYNYITTGSTGTNVGDIIILLCY